MTDINKTIKLKKDGTPDRRGGKVGNKGNRYATGRKRIAGQETRKHISFKATDSEYKLLLQYAHILKSDYDSGIAILEKAGLVPDGRAKKDSTRRDHVIRVLEREKKPVRDMLAIIKDRYDLIYLLLTNYNNIQDVDQTSKAGSLGQNH